MKKKNIKKFISFILLDLAFLFAFYAMVVFITNQPNPKLWGVVAKFSFIVLGNFAAIVFSILTIFFLKNFNEK